MHENNTHEYTLLVQMVGYKKLAFAIAIMLLYSNFLQKLCNNKLHGFVITVCCVKCVTTANLYIRTLLTKNVISHWVSYALKN